MDDVTQFFDVARNDRQTLTFATSKEVLGRGGWTRMTIARIENLSAADFGAGLPAKPMVRI